MPEVLAAARAPGALRDADAEGGSTAVLLDALEAIARAPHREMLARGDCPMRPVS